MKTSDLNLYILLATHNRIDLLRRTLDSLALCEKPKEYQQTLVIENGGEYGAKDVVDSFPEHCRFRYLFTSEANKSKALNFGLNNLPISDRVFIYFTDDDVRFCNEVLTRFVMAAIDTDGREFYAGPVKIDYVEEPCEWIIPYLPASACGLESTSNDVRMTTRKYPWDTFGLGFNWAAFRSDLEDVGLFSSKFGPGAQSGASGQETNMMIRLINNGVRNMFVPKAYVWHYVPPDRCSPEWALQRAYKAGIFHGQASCFPAVSRIVWTIKYNWYSVLNLLRPIASKSTCFWIEWKLKSLSGRLKGLSVKPDTGE